MPHKFKIGQSVYLDVSVLRPASRGVYEIVRLLPTELDEPQYRIRSKSETFERLVKQSDLRAT